MSQLVYFGNFVGLYIFSRGVHKLARRFRLAGANIQLGKTRICLGVTRTLAYHRLVYRTRVGVAVGHFVALGEREVRLAIALVDQQRLLVAGYRAFIIELGQVAVALGRERFNLAHCVNPRGDYERCDGEQYNAGE